MNIGVIFIAVIYIAVQILATNQKKKREAEQKARQAPQAERPAQARADERTPAVPQRRSAFPGFDDIFPDVGNAPAPAKPKPKAPVRPPVDDRFPDLTPAPKRGSLQGRSSEGFGTGRSMPNSAAEGKHTTYTPTISQSVQTDAVHTVQAMTESDHYHIESSMTGIAPPCAPEIAPPTQAQQAQTSADAAYNLPVAAGLRHFAFDRTSVVQGLLYGEILGKPKALRR
ncbi:MAG: hypothetical protein Q4E65_09645 [Clostridia bacterium]|nr:hypothetical protein [Clostridia bacterium]